MTTTECRSIWLLLQQEIVEVAVVTTRTLRHAKLQSNAIIPIQRFFYRPNDFPLVQPLKTVKELMAENVQANTQ